MLEHGVYLPPSQYEAWFVEFAHNDEAIDKTIDAAEASFAAVAAIKSALSLNHVALSLAV